MTIAVVIPACNEAKTIADIVQRTLKQTDHVIVVDDGSIDDTAMCAKKAGAILLRQETNQGKGAALWRGMHYAIQQGAHAVITLDADGQHCPEDISRLVNVYQQHKGHLIIAARLKHRERAPFLRRFANKTADFWVSWAAGYPICDTQSGFRLYPVTFLNVLPPIKNGRQGFVFESEALIEAARRGYYPITIAVETLYPKQARPSHYRPWRDTTRIIIMVAGKLLKWGMYPIGLLRSLEYLPLQVNAIQKNAQPPASITLSRLYAKLKSITF